MSKTKRDERYASTGKQPNEENRVQIRKTICDICNPMSHCGIDAHVKNGVVIKVEGTNMALQQIMKDYAGTLVRAETLLGAGLKYFNDLKEKALNMMMAETSHELMRCMEVLDLMECGEMILITAQERKETRGLHIRSDFPFTNPLLAEKWITIRKENGQPKVEWREKK